MRPIDADALYDKAETWYKNAPTPFRLIYRSFVDAIADAPTIVLPPNDPLTLEQLREMDGEPVYDVDGKCYIVNVQSGYATDKYRGFRMLWGNDSFYRYKPEEE